MKQQVRFLMLALGSLALTLTLAAQAPRATLEGIWSFTVDPDPEGLPTYSGLRSFSKGGTAIALDAVNTAPAGGLISMGVWERSGGHEFSFVMYAVVTTNGIQTGLRKIEGVVTLDASGNTLSGIGKTASYDLAGNVLFSGTARLAGVRLPLID
jgi:hypothetical protein